MTRTIQSFLAFAERTISAQQPGDFFLLLDGSIHSGFPDALSVEGRPLVYQALFSGTPDEERAEYGPYLVKWMPDTAIWSESRDWDSTPYGVSLLRSGLSLAELARHLQQHMLRRTEDRDELYLRLADTRTLMEYQSALGDKHWRPLISPISGWWCHDRDGKLHTIQATRVSESAVSPIALSLADQERLLNVAMPDLMWSDLRRYLPDLPEHGPSIAEQRLLRHALDLLHNAKVETWAKQIQFSAQALQQGEAWLRLPATRAALESAQTTEMKETTAQ